MNYDKYLKSDHWANKKEQYKRSSLPQYCIVCKEEKYQLHHVTYRNLYKEKMTDFVPLCRKCHIALHECLDSRKLGVDKSLDILHNVFKVPHRLLPKTKSRKRKSKSKPKLALSYDEFLKKKEGQSNYLYYGKY